MREPYANIAIVLLVAVLGAALLLSVAAPLMHFWGVHTITVSATGTASGTPEYANIYMYANGTGISSVEAAANLSATLGVLNSTLMTYVGGNESNVSTDSYTLAKVNSTMPYAATESLHATIGIGKVGALLEILASIPNVYVSRETSMLSGSQADTLRSSALSSAVVNATAQAHAVVGQDAILTPINITASSYRIYPIYGTTATAGSSIEYYPGTAQVTGTVSVVFSYIK